MRNMADEVLYGANSGSAARSVDLPAGDHEISYELEMLLKQGRYAIATTLGADQNSAFGDIPRWATPKAQAFFDVLGNTGSPFYGACKIPMKYLLEVR